MTANVPQQPPPPYSEIPPGSTQENYLPISAEPNLNHHICKILEALLKIAHGSIFFQMLFPLPHMWPFHKLSPSWDLTLSRQCVWYVAKQYKAEFTLITVPLHWLGS